MFVFGTPVIADGRLQSICLAIDKRRNDTRGKENDSIGCNGICTTEGEERGVHDKAIDASRNVLQKDGHTVSTDLTNDLPREVRLYKLEDLLVMHKRPHTKDGREEQCYAISKGRICDIKMKNSQKKELKNRTENGNDKTQDH